MLEDGLRYSDSKMSSRIEYLEHMKSFDVADSNAVWKGGPILYRDKDKVFVDDSEAHTLIVGDTGSMKTLRYVLPLIYSCAMGEESMVIIDPKGELEKKMSPFLSKKGYVTAVVNLRTPHTSKDQWNPMDRIQRTFLVDRENAVLQLNDLLNCLFFNRSEADKDKYWNETAGQFALGIIELMEAIGDDLNMKNLLKWRYEKLRDGTLEEH